ncbi:MAG: SpoIIE family protein phosphatase [Myxococcaceae bacterium]|nr:SpoIIE family protein phosphatase [Myxococcaceae bacterium]
MSSTLLVLLVVVANGVASVVSTQRQFELNAAASTTRFQDQARELGQTLSNTLSLTVSSALRDNSFGPLTEVVASLVKANPNVVRVQAFNSELESVADSDKAAKLGTPLGRPATKSWVISTFNGDPTFEYQEPVNYGSESGPGVLVLSYSAAELQRQLATLDAEKQAAVREVTLRTAALAVGFLVVALVVAMVLARRISKPIDQLTHSAMQLSNGDLSVRVDPAKGGGREVVALGYVFNFMATRLTLLLDGARQRAALERDIQVARQVQETIQPTRDPFVIGNLRVAGVCVSADACGGDWWTRLQLDGGRIALGLGDVTGHGLSTSLIAASATSGFVSALRLREASEQKADVLMRGLNQTMFDLARGQHQMSGTLALIDSQTGAFEIAAGGHPPAYVFNRLTGRLSSLTARGSLLGASSEGTFPVLRGSLKEGDIVVWYTDGVTEARNAEGRLYETQRLTQALQRYANLPCEQLRDAVLADVNEFSAGRSQQDDMTVIVAEFGADARFATAQPG